MFTRNQYKTGFNILKMDLNISKMDLQNAVTFSRECYAWEKLRPISQKMIITEQEMWDNHHLPQIDRRKLRRYAINEKMHVIELV